MSVIKDTARKILYGLAIGDALGVPVEFIPRELLARTPIRDMTGYRTHNQPEGTWSDDTSLALCLAETIAEGFDLKRLADKFVAWKYSAYMTAGGQVFDIGIATSEAISLLKQGYQPDLCGGTAESSNGNGSLMRILPLILHIKDLPLEERLEVISKVSSVTHGHIRSVLCCIYYLEYALLIERGIGKFEAYELMKTHFMDILDKMDAPKKESTLFNRLLKEDIHKFSITHIYSSGYVLHTLEASIWCILNNNSYKEAALKAVNMGDDTDTTGCVTGGLAALLFGFEDIPSEWIKKLKGKALFERVISKFNV